MSVRELLGEASRQQLFPTRSFISPRGFVGEGAARCYPAAQPADSIHRQMRKVMTRVVQLPAPAKIKTGLRWS